MEVFDNFSHDGIRYDVATEEPLQGHVLIDADGDFYEFYSQELDPVVARYFRVRHAATGGQHPKPYPSNPALRYLSTKMPFAGNLSDPEFVPTRLMQFFDVLERYFPGHRLVTSDFHALPNAIKGLNAPVVQTRYQRRMVPVTTPLVSSTPLPQKAMPNTKTNYSQGPSGILRHPLPHGLQHGGVNVSCHHGEADEGDVAWGL